MEFEQGWSLLFKLHESRSNIILLCNGSVQSIFRNHLKNDLTLTVEDLDRQIDWSRTYFLNNVSSIKKKYFTFGKKVWSHLETLGFDSLDSDAKWDLIEKTLEQLNEPKFYITKSNNLLSLLLFKEGDVLKKFTDPIEAIDFFYQVRSISDQLETEKRRALKELEDKIGKAEKYIEINTKRLKEITAEPYRQWADLLMANMTNETSNKKVIVVTDFYDNNKAVSIPIKPGVPIQKTAEQYYRKAKNQNKEIDKLRESIQAKKEIISKLINSKGELDTIRDLKSFKEKFGKVKKSSPAQQILPFHSIDFNNYEILIGKNASSNDILTLHHAKKNDLWLHAKDVAGSHVVIKHKSGTNFPKSVIERAAELAAYYSKRKNEMLCPVAFTEKKYVRKRKGDPAGVVVVEKEKVILVKPQGY
ncbi:MAG: DUF814 domain-containing protein [Flammeovirgaceae bacterium]|nr:DUF814 domain-containing protein [Flammeovirgaceae bacterium]